MVETNETPTGALHNTKVLDLTIFGAGPVSTMLLGDMGADVVKLERPVTGDMARWNGPLVEDMGGYFPAFNRNKRSITLNVYTPKGKELFKELVNWADVVVENFRPGTIERWGFPFETLQTINKRLILVSISGFGQTGPYSQRTSFDTVGQASGGMMAVTGQAEGHPIAAGAPIADLTGGLFGTIGTLLALHYLHTSGKGQWVDVSMMEGMIYFMGLPLVRHARLGPSPEVNEGIPGNKSTFLTKDGSWIIILSQDDNHWRPLSRIIGRPELSEDPKYNSRASRMAQGGQFLRDVIQEWVSTVTLAEAEEVLETNSIPFSKAMTIQDLLKDPHVESRNAIHHLSLPTSEVVPVPGVFPKMSESPGSVRLPSPRLGEHNKEIYGDILGVSDEELEQLRSEQII